MMEAVEFLKLTWERNPQGWLVFAVCAVALIKAWPILAKQASDARAVMRKERRDDLDDCRNRLDAMGERVDKAEMRVHDFEMKLLGALAAYRILDAEVEQHLPDSSALAQARIVLSSAFVVSPSTPDNMKDIVREAV